MELNLMNLKAGFTKRTEALRQHPKYVVLGMFGLFLLNLSVFIYAVNKFWYMDRLLASLFSVLFLWPILLIVFGIIRLRRGNSTDEREIKRRREVTLRYFGFGTSFLLILMIALWSYSSSVVTLSRRASGLVFFVIPILILSALLVTITWHWIRNSDNRLSVYLNRAPRQYLISAIAFVTTLICYSAYSDIRELIRTDPPFFRGDSLFITSMVLQLGLWLSALTAIGSAVLGYLRPSHMSEAATDQANKRRQVEPSIRVESTPISKQGDLTSLTLESTNLEQLLSRVELSNSKLETLISRAERTSHPLVAAEIVAERIGLIRGRLTGELKDLSKRGNLNLMIGILTTLAAASALFWGLIATQPSPNETEVAGLLRHYLPRISFAVFIEVFSFFFLRLYKNSLEDIKYYHNELTNLDSRLLALEIAAAQVPEALTSILLGLLNTDRNFILKSGESTVELEKVKTEQQYMRTLINTISNKIPDLNLAKTDGK